MRITGIDQQLIRQIRQLAKKECANYADGLCIPEDRPCHVIHPAYEKIHDGAIDCDWFLNAVAPLQPELDAAIWHEIFRDEKATGEGWKECVRCRQSFLLASNRQQYCPVCGKIVKQERSREKQRRYRQRKKQDERYPLEA